jgi:hypothetical protein
LAHENKKQKVDINNLGRSTWIYAYQFAIKVRVGDFESGGGGISFWAASVFDWIKNRVSRTRRIVRRLLGGHRLTASEFSCQSYWQASLPIGLLPIRNGWAKQRST